MWSTLYVYCLLHLMLMKIMNELRISKEENVNRVCVFVDVGEGSRYKWEYVFEMRRGFL